MCGTGHRAAATVVPYLSSPSAKWWVVLSQQCGWGVKLWMHLCGGGACGKTQRGVYVKYSEMSLTQI